MRLENFACLNTKVSDLPPLAGMKLYGLICAFTQVSDLLPLKGMSLTDFYCQSTQVSDLSILQGVTLARVAIAHVPLNYVPFVDAPPTQVTQELNECS